MNDLSPQPAVIYCRVSSVSQVTRGHGLEGQETRCRAYAEAQGYSVEAAFPDDVSGGGDFMNRPGMVNLLNYIDAQPLKNYVIIFDDLKRFARDTEFHRKLRRELDARGARPECLNFRFEDTPEGEFVETIMAAQGELERKQNRRQVIQKMKARAEAGYWMFGKPMGYRYEAVAGQGRMLVRDEPTASAIADALERYASGQLSSIAELHRFLNANPAIQGQRKDGTIKIDSAKALLQRPIYAGHLHLPKWGIHMLKGQHEPLISLDTYQRIQERLNGRPVAPIRKDTDPDFPLRGFIACDCCGHPMTGAMSKGRSRYYPYYFCNQKGCDLYRKNIRGETLEADFEAFLAELRPQPALLKVLASILRELWDERAGRAKTESQAARAELTKLDAEIERTISRAIAAESDAMARRYEARVAELENRRALLAEKAAAKVKPRRSLEDTIRTATTFLLNPLNLWNSERLEDRNLTLRLVFEKPLAYCRENGIRTADLTLPFKVLADFDSDKSRMVGDLGIEPSVSRLEGVTVPCHTLRPVAHRAPENFRR